MYPCSASNHGLADFVSHRSLVPRSSALAWTVRIVKQRLLEMIPDLKVFLDVDDLEDISDLEGYIERTQQVFIYCSQGYFQSKNCLREIICAQRMGKAVIACVDHDQSRGGLTLAQIREQLHAAEGSYEKWGFDGETPTGAQLYAKLFECEPLEWERIGAFQDVTMRLIAERILEIGGSRDARSMRLPTRERGSTREPPAPGAAPEKKYYMQGETSFKAVLLPPPNGRRGKAAHAYCSPHNPGSQQLLEELARSKSLRVRTTARLEDLGRCEHMLLYLHGRTWTAGAMSEALAREVRAAMDIFPDLL